MKKYILYTYANFDEFHNYEEGKIIHPFIFGQTQELLEDNPNSIIDISALMYLLKTNPENRYAAQTNLLVMTEETTIIVEDAIADFTLEKFPYIFSKKQAIFPCEVIEKNSKATNKPYNRQWIYTYNNNTDLNMIIEFANNHNIPIASFPRASGILQSNFEEFNKRAELVLVDLSSMAYAIEDNKNIIYSVEQFLNLLPNLKVTVITEKVDKLLEFFPLYFCGYKPIKDLLPNVEYTQHSEESSKIMITNFTSEKIDLFAVEFNSNLIGHSNFRERFIHSLKNFIILNKAKEQKIFSIFLFGSSGIGKTEVARLICNGMLPNSYLAKINFQNYSSQDALNNLIGSPAGYIGCEHGELSDKVKKSKVGLILCDEFEKANRPVFNFFLELLEEGKFTDSMAREYDMDGYIIVFTSNLKSESEYKEVIPLELQTRFDMVCEFEEPSNEEKTQFLELLLNKAKEKFSNQFCKINMTEKEKVELFNFNYANMNALRDIKREFNQRLMDYFSSKGV